MVFSLSPLRFCCLVLILTVFAAVCLAATPGRTIAPRANSPILPPRVHSPRIPLHFEPNAGQTHPSIRFTARSSGMELLLTDKGAFAVMQQEKQAGGSPLLFDRAIPKPPLETHVVELKLIGANSRSVFRGLDELPGVSNYLIGKDPTKWRTNILNYSRFERAGVYAGVDMVFY